MNEVEKMYSNAGVEAKNKCKSSQCIVTNPHPDWCNKCESLSKVYPPFTAEKQLEIVKQILFSTWWMNLKRLQFSEKFDEGLAQMISDLWQDLTEEERKQIKEMLSE